MLRSPVIADKIVIGFSGVACEQRDQLMERSAAVERSYKRLHDAYGAVVRASITPGFQEISLGDVPMTEFSSFIVVETAMNAQRHLKELLRKLQIGGRGEDGIAAENE